jgi:hypothetical protein
MSNTTNQPEFKITLEEVLRLKRSERPPAEFWDRFDRDLRQKTLRALVNEDPMARRFLSPIISRILVAVPVSALALTALFFFVVGDPVNVSERGFAIKPGLTTHPLGQIEATVMGPAQVTSVRRTSMNGHSYTMEQTVSFPGTQFVISVMHSRSRGNSDFDVVMTPRILTASSDSNARYVANPLTSDSPSATFATAPAVAYF